MKKDKSILFLILFIGLFLFSVYITQFHSQFLVEIIGNKSFLVLLFYILIVIISTVFAPLSSLVLIPVISSSWGIIISALASVIGWFIGSIIAFWISRTYGKSFVIKIVSEEKIKMIEDKFLGKNAFWTIVILRMIIPVDVLSYILGLFNITWKTYIFATFIGIIPFSFIFSIFGILPIKQILMWII